MFCLHYPTFTIRTLKDFDYQMKIKLYSVNPKKTEVYKMVKNKGMFRNKRSIS